ncbi:MAG: hypothetical protein JXB88_21485 [Spirochaetales bacterium]|nr:hypothetical protein [Spirochaetales bacterium]
MKNENSHIFFTDILCSLLSDSELAIINNKLAEILLSRGRFDDPMALRGSANGRTYGEWKNYVENTEIEWWQAGAKGSRFLNMHPVPRGILYEVYALLEQTNPGETLEVRTTLDNFHSFTLKQLFDLNKYHDTENAFYQILCN